MVSDVSLKLLEFCVLGVKWWASLEPHQPQSRTPPSGHNQAMPASQLQIKFSLDSFAKGELKILLNYMHMHGNVVVAIVSSASVLPLLSSSSSSSMSLLLLLLLLLAALEEMGGKI